MTAGDRLRDAIQALEDGAFATAARLAEPLYYADPARLESLLVLGLALSGCGHPDLAADLLDEVAARRPGAPHPAGDVVRLLDRAGRGDAVAAYFAAARALAPEDARLLVAEGEWRMEQGQAGAARAALEAALALRPDDGAAELALCTLMAEEGALDGAIARLRRLLERTGPRPAALNNLGLALSHQGHFEEAFGNFRQALALAPGDDAIHLNHGMALLRAGRLAEGWPEFDRRRGLYGPPALPPARLLAPLRPGQRLDGQVVMATADRGFGDMLQFARYLPLLAERGARVLAWVPEELRRLFQGIPGVAEVLSGHVALPRLDAHCPFMRLAQVFGTTLETIPAGIPYITPDPALVPHRAARLPPRAAGRRRVGLVWAGSPRSAAEPGRMDRRRSLPLAALAPLATVPGIDWISLQKGETARAQAPPPGLALHDAMAEVRDFADTAALLASLDAVVAVDTAIVHLAGAMGKPVLMLDRYDSCWRWLTGREDSPWYPTLRIIRQERFGDWQPVVRRAAAILADGR
ncbi:tetratricopeptide repeat protein [Roseomonas sp. OT10]|uniref:tetratricopeptide repeat protein n=1 Tax=Roseomonas cutis TaxID=2897332 RepID=UPI001E57FF7B|nr:tetratricopeptide repeat protein [Roseomonas sp. OT10]UFN49312.1 tetratricopeptide repeat protein [Roseomonas sp. OT10]